MHAIATIRSRCMQAFEIVARPAVDSFNSALDRLKMGVYVQCARWGLPCPITGGSGQIVQQAQQAHEQASVN